MDACDKWDCHSVTSARVDMCIDNNGTWSDAFQFGYPNDTTWTLEGQTFSMDVQLNMYDTTPKISLTTLNSRIIVDDIIQRVIHLNVLATDIRSYLEPGTYVYDLVMINGTGTRVPLMHGTVTVSQGVTYP